MIIHNLPENWRIPSRVLNRSTPRSKRLMGRAFQSACWITIDIKFMGLQRSYIWIGWYVLDIRIFNLIRSIMALAESEVLCKDSERWQLIWDDLFDIDLFHVKFGRNHERTHHVLLVVLCARGLFFLNLFLLRHYLLDLDNNFGRLEEIK